MSEVYNLSQENFDITKSANFVEHPDKFVERAANTTLELGRVCMEYSRVFRKPRYDETSRESDVEHSFMTALLSTEVSVQYYPDYDHGLVTQFGLIHDIIELITDDMATFNITAEELEAKDINEKNALPEILKRLPPYWANLLERYERQEEPEARFVASREKDDPYIVDILGPGKKVMSEDYDVHTLEKFNKCEDDLRNRFRKRFPEPELELTHNIREYHGMQFSKEFQ